MNQVSELFPRPDIKKKLGVGLSIKFPFKYFFFGEKSSIKSQWNTKSSLGPTSLNADALIYGGMGVWVRSTSISRVS